MSTGTQGFNTSAMTADEFDDFMKQTLKEWNQTVLHHPDYYFARNGQTLSLGDWFEQFATRSGLM
jgi:hypothetical protein